MDFKGTKPIVRYSKDKYMQIELNKRAYVMALNHPRLGNQRVDTSTVLGLLCNGDGIQAFETRNTIYVLDSFDIPE